MAGRGRRNRPRSLGLHAASEEAIYECLAGEPWPKELLTIEMWLRSGRTHAG